MTETKVAHSRSEAIESELVLARDLWISRHKKKRESWEETNARITLVHTTVLEQPGGRLVVQTQTTGRGVTRPEYTYNRWQLVRDEGFVRVYHRDM